MGELGWELYVPSEMAAHVYDVIVDAGEAFGLRHAGYHALNSLRIEKAYRHWGHDMSDEDTVLEAGLGFTVAWDKPGGFTGRDALLRQRDTGLTRRLAVFVLDDPEPLMYHNEPIWRDDSWSAGSRSAMFGHTIGRSIGLGYVRRSEDPSRPSGSPPGATRWRSPWSGLRDASFRAPYDPTNPASGPDLEEAP